uniref:Putative secreted protein n=1 Tax=Anopheles darlingi TaxID=43151 RepID=A0A2M4DFL5_ANODA
MVRAGCCHLLLDLLPARIVGWRFKSSDGGVVLVQEILGVLQHYIRFTRFRTSVVKGENATQAHLTGTEHNLRCLAVHRVVRFRLVQ